MKNTSVIHLAGAGFFSLTFLSPINNDNIKAEFTNRHSGLESAKTVMLTIPKLVSTTGRNLSHFFTSIQTKSIRKEVPSYSDDQLTIEDSSTTNISDQAANYLQPIEPKSTKKQNEKVISVSDELEQPDSATVLIYHPKKDSSFILPDPDKNISETDSSETLNPPTFYIDEAQQKTQLLTSSTTPIISTSTEAGIDSYPEELFQQRIKALKESASQNGFSSEHGFLINLGLKSGRKRFYIIDLKNEEIVTSGLVAHGKGKEKFTLKKTYSNTNGSSCSSLGLYKVGTSYTGSFGKSFRLIGLQKSNNNALTRAIVLHAMGCIPDEEMDYPICQSEGCPSVSISFLKKLEETISKTKQPILLWVFDPLVDNK